MKNLIIKIFVLSFLTYSSNIMLLSQRFYDITIFVDAAFIFAIYYSFYAIIGGSLRLLKFETVDKYSLNIILTFRIILGLCALSFLFFIDQHILVSAIIARKTFEWIVDPIISFLQIKEIKIFFPIVVIDGILLLFLLLDIKYFQILIIWTFIPVVAVSFSIIYFKIYKSFFLNLKKISTLTFFTNFIGFEGPGALLSILFRGYIKINTSVFLADALFLTMVFSAIVNVITKVVIPTLPKIKLITIKRKNELNLFLGINILLLIFLVPFSNSLPYLVCLYIFLFFFFLQLLAILDRKSLIENNLIKTVNKTECFIGIFISTLLSLFVYYELPTLLGWFYVINALMNWLIYSNYIKQKS